jgi:xanthine/uracil/vitamin C permease (AzgA family)
VAQDCLNSSLHRTAAAVVPPYATAPALLFVACLMLRDLAGVDRDEATESLPAAPAHFLCPLPGTRRI